MLPLRSRQYVCWRCLARNASSRPLPARPRGLLACRTAAARGLATVHHADTPSLPQEPALDTRGSQDAGPQGAGAKNNNTGIRERLRAWDEKNPNNLRVLPKHLQALGGMGDFESKGIKRSTDEIEVDLDSQDLHYHLFEGDDLVDLRTSTADIKAGDLVEISPGSSQIQLLAVCLGEFNGYQHFYTNSGKWFTSRGVRTFFTVKGFADASDVQPVADALPSKSASVGLLNMLQDIKATPSRHVGARLIRKMASFLHESRFIYQSNAGKLDSAFRYLSGEERAMTLPDIAGILLHKGFVRKGRLPPEALYAVHRALINDDVSFRPASRADHSQSYIYTIASEADVSSTLKVEAAVQQFYDETVRIRGNWSDENLAKGSFGQFILKARRAIDSSRRVRGWTPHGMLSSSSAPAPPAETGWSKYELGFIHFLHMWAAQEKYRPKSRYQWLGAAILRVLERYRECEVLDEAVAWTFLQEIGWFKPWEIQARYRFRLPGVDLERGGGVKPLPAAAARLPDTDAFAGRRRDFAGMRIFCIDAESALDIDDGVSLEPAETPGEYWIHVHVADPASRVSVGSPSANQAAALSQNVYLHGHFSRMFTDDSVRDAFSLAPDRPSLTFSSRVDGQGALLDYKITPGVVRDVTYMTSDEVFAACGEEKPDASSPGPSFAVGLPPSPAARRRPPNRPMTKAVDLAAEDIQNLRILSRLARRLQSKRLSKGAMPRYVAGLSVDVGFDGVEVEQSPDGFMRCSGDPHIRVSYAATSNHAIVDSCMQLAGEAAARWCHERGVPVPYRVQPKAAKNMDALRRFAEDVLYPQLDGGRRPPEESWHTARSLTGGYDLSTVPTPHFFMGLDMYTKVTSPLRRYADLLVHWQVEAALLEEQRRGASLVGNADDSFLPFTRDELEREVLPMLRLRERHSLVLGRSFGTAEWVLQALVRAWKFGDPVTEGGPLPRTFRFTVRDVVERRILKGTLDWFERTALMDYEALAGAAEDGRPLMVTDVNIGDVFEVELADVIVCRRRILVRALRRIENRAAGRAVPPQPDEAVRD